MKTGIIPVILIALLSLLSCSGDKTDEQTPKQSAPVSVETQPAYPNSPTAQDLQPDLHVSGTQSTHVSGAVETSEHISGQ